MTTPPLPLPPPDLLWPEYSTPSSLAAIEQVALADRNLPASTYAVLTRAAELWPDRPAMTFLPGADSWQSGRTRTYADLRAEVDRIAALFRSHAVCRGVTVGLLSPNTALLPSAFLAAQATGIAAPVNPHLPAEHITRLLERARARVLVAAGPELDPAGWATARTVAAELHVTALYALRPTGAEGPGPGLEPLPGTVVAHLDAAAAGLPDAAHPQPPTAGDLAALFHTGGTTGAPKLAAHTHTNQVVDAWSITANSLLGEDSTVFAGLPLFHVNALVVTLIAPMLRGQHVVWAGPLGYREPALYSRIWKIIERYRISAMSAVPTVYSVLAHVSVDADISSMRFAAVGASALPDTVRTAFTANTGIELCEGYGLTEATCATARSFTGADRRPGSVGQRLPYQQVRTVLVDTQGNWLSLPDGAPGVLLVKGPTVFAGYVTGHGPTGPRLDGQATVRDGWLNTGDLARVDKDGFIHLLGRAKDLIIRGGHNIDPAAIEDALLHHPYVTGASAVGRPDPHAGEVPIAYVTLAPGAPEAMTGSGALIAHARTFLHEKAAVPKDVIVLDSLPVTAVGKPTKVPLRMRTLTQTALDELAALGLSCRPDRVRCHLDGPRLTVTVPRPADIADADRITAALGRYTFDWTFAERER
ncbi:acyl-CoA synthetase [Streptomyces sp. ZAF1911]|uniref:acyl-CoA synthetase n=1 Tax=Streptomyces sp. ZAF1911 TaxID=2944129 RepID=UPI00237BD889|nr:acyl-CoA synthetase [Streptomyces sp. ZAF1911]MDD9375180.1 acyl-CoA synthetase [Streptomyces sp. ZAF1911]